MQIISIYYLSFALLISFSFSFSQECQPGFVYHSNSCYQCGDLGCLQCRSINPRTCYQCRPEFTLYEKQCGMTTCDSIKHCELCTENQTECIKCKKICIVDNGECNCVERIVIIVVCILIGITVIAIVAYCLTKTGRLHNEAIVEIVTLRPQNLNSNRVRNYNSLEKKNCITIDNLEDFDELFEKSKIIIGKNVENKKCDFCQIQSGSLKLSCGCYLCYEDEKKVLLIENKGKICPVCKNEVNDTMTNCNCGICFQNKSELARFRCGCALVVCKNCFIQWKKEKQICPACRGII